MQIPRNNFACKFQGTLYKEQKVIPGFGGNSGFRLRPEITSPLLQTLHPLRMFNIVFRGSSLIRNNCLYFVCCGWSAHALTAVATLAISVAW